METGKRVILIDFSVKVWEDSKFPSASPVPASALQGRKYHEPDDISFYMLLLNAFAQEDNANQK